jgi:hypothetical protein
VAPAKEISMPTVWRLRVFGFLISQKLQQPTALNLISWRITFRLSYQPSEQCCRISVVGQFDCGRVTGLIATDLGAYLPDDSGRPLG